MEVILHLDFETRSACDLKACGVAVYAADPSTDILVAAWSLGEEGMIESWYPGGRVPDRLRQHVSRGGKVAAHNAVFEFYINNYVAHQKYGWPLMAIEQMVDTMAMGYAMGLPGQLGKLAPALGLKENKDEAGQRVMMQLSKPRRVQDGKIFWVEDPKKYDILVEYNKQDVRVEKLAMQRMKPLSASEQKLWVLDQRINNRGIQIDVEAVKKAIVIVEATKEKLDAKMREVTKNFVASCTAVAQIRDWLKSHNINTASIQKSDVVELLNDPSLPPVIRQALTLRQEAGKASTAKLSSMLNRVSADGRIRSTMQYHGAQATGRWAGRGIQPHNMPRQMPDAATTEAIFEAIRSQDAAWIEVFHGPPLQIISSILRSFLIAAPGKILRWGDFNAVEARVTAWLANEEAALKVFREGGDPYVAAYAKAFGVPPESVTKEQRGIGKVMVLAFGFGGGVGAFQVMAKAYGVSKPDKEVDGFKKAWRAGHANIVNYWYALERQAILAIKHPGQIFPVGIPGRQIKYLTSGSFLLCQLPSGRVITYPYPKVEQVETPWKEMRDGITYMTEDADTKQWVRQKAWYGILVENIVQATARDLLVYAMWNLEERGHTISFHVHDEAVAEVQEGFSSCKEMEEIMSMVPSWAKDLPLAAEAHEGKRYRK